MKLISLNTWAGRAQKALGEFIESQKETTDIFCFQEVFTSSDSSKSESNGWRIHLFEELGQLLDSHIGIFHPVQEGLDFDGRVDFPLTLGQTTFVRKTIPILSSGKLFTYLEEDQWTDEKHWPTCVGYVRIPFRESHLTICNFHGMSLPGDKEDSPERIAQSKKIIEFLAQEDGAKILCGDFNLMPETESIGMIEKTGMIDLIKTFRIERTRSALSPWWGKDDFQKFADYAFVSNDVDVLRFSVPDSDASDHLPLILEFSEK